MLKQTVRCSLVGTVATSDSLESLWKKMHTSFETATLSSLSYLFSFKTNGKSGLSFGRGENRESFFFCWFPLWDEKIEYFTITQKCFGSQSTEYHQVVFHAYGTIQSILFLTLCFQPNFFLLSPLSSIFYIQQNTIQLSITERDAVKVERV